MIDASGRSLFLRSEIEPYMQVRRMGNPGKKAPPAPKAVPLGNYDQPPAKAPPKPNGAAGAFDLRALHAALTAERSAKVAELAEIDAKLAAVRVLAPEIGGDA